ncbi:helix-turn-helix domain-containing protein [Nocardia abscessus]|uniref:helix-turn-helix domain-containing protein n=1 Tax=Nocardia abscessus TaxID=120957 RepID=UPI000315A0A4|nr:hypothetical protein [Nocardia abscessus]MCC3328097.1 hypothetical protein [Nocardia abscessus]
MIIYRWTGVETKALRDAMHLGVEKFSARTGIGARTITNWELQGASAQLRPSSQELLAKVLTEAPPEVIARFERALAGIGSPRDQPDPGLPPTVTLANDTPRRLVPVTSGGAGEIDQVWVRARTAAGEVVLVSLPRRTVVAGFGVSALAAAVGVKPAAALANSSQVDHAAHFRTLRLSLIDSDNLHGGPGVIPLIEQNLEIMNELRRAGVGDATEMQRMRILYAEFAAWLHQDARNWARAQHWTDRALTWSHQLGDDYCIAATLIRKAQIANDMHDGAEAIELAEAAERAAPPRTRFAAVAATFAGYAAALAGDRAASDRAFDRARALAADADVDPSWGFFLDDTYIDVHQAHGRAALGDYRAAIDQFGRAINNMQSGYTRDQAVYMSRQALAYAHMGEAEPAATLGLAAMQIGVSTGSERVLHNVRAVDELLSARNLPEVAEFRAAAERWAVVPS